MNAVPERAVVEPDQQPARRRATLSDVVLLMRPRQWTKNLAVFAAIIFSRHLFALPLLGRVVVAFLALDLVVSGLYAMNDAMDAERDSLHPIKRERPVASGRIGVRHALALSALFVALGLTLSALLDAGFFLAVAAYVLLQVLYNFWLKRLAIVEMLAIASGFVIRAVAGALVIHVRISPWLLLCTGMLALFLAAAKRRHEIVLLKGASELHRPVLAEYSAELLDGFMVTLSAATVTAYALYTFFEAHPPGYLLMTTIPFVIYGVLRYQVLVLSGEGGRPEEVLLTDRPILLDVALWGATAVLVLYVVPLLGR